MESGDGKFTRAVSTRTLTDVIHDETETEGRRMWRQFKDKIRNHARGGGAAWTSNLAVPASDVPIQTPKKRVMFRHASGRVTPGPPESDPGMQPESDPACLRRNSSNGRGSSRSLRFDDPSPLRRLQEEEAEEEAGKEEAGEEEDGDGEGEKPAKMSLMSLLAESDDEFGMEEEEEEEDEEEDDGGDEFNNCGVCMVRHKGTPFEPCGHSFCRLCSREMWVQGGHCPLCDNYILEILDIF